MNQSPAEDNDQKKPPQKARGLPFAKAGTTGNQFFHPKFINHILFLTERELCGVHQLLWICGLTANVSMAEFLLLTKFHTVCFLARLRKEKALLDSTARHISLSCNGALGIRL